MLFQLQQLGWASWVHIVLHPCSGSWPKGWKLSVKPVSRCCSRAGEWLSLCKQLPGPTQEGNDVTGSFPLLGLGVRSPIFLANTRGKQVQRREFILVWGYFRPCVSGSIVSGSLGRQNHHGGRFQSVAVHPMYPGSREYTQREPEPHLQSSPSSNQAWPSVVLPSVSHLFRFWSHQWITPLSPHFLVTSGKTLTAE